MARNTKKPPEEPHRPPALAIRRQEAVSRITARLAKASQIQARFEAADASSAEQEYEAWHRYNVEMLARMFTDASIAEAYEHCGPAYVISMGGRSSLAARRGDFFDWERAQPDNRLLERFAAKIARLEQVREQLELYEEPPSAEASAASSGGSAPTVKRRAAFVVHGHDEAAREATARVLQQLDIEPVILHEQVNRGQTIIEKFEQHSEVPFAVVLLTPDDVGSAKGQSNLQPRARQNVWFELGFFAGKLGRSYVCALYKGPLEIPSDVQGVIYTQMDDAGAWRFQLAKELHAGGISVDLNRLLPP